MAPLGKALMALGVMLFLAGVLLWGLGGMPLVGRLPGDFYVRRGNLTFYFPLASSILVSMALTLLLMLFRR